MSATLSDTKEMQSDREDPSNALLLSQEQDSYDSVTLDDIEIIEYEPPTSFFDVFKEISRIAIPMGLSFTLSFEIFLTVLLLQLLSESDEDTAAAALATTMMSTVCILAVSPFVIVSNNLSGKLGKWREEEKKQKREIEAIETIPAIEEYDTEREKERIEVISTNSFLIASVIAVPATFILYYSGPIMTSVLHQNSTVAHSAQKFLRPFSFSVPALMTKMCLEQIIFGFGTTRPAMIMALTTLSIGASLSVLLGFGIKIGPLEFPKMNQEGVALGFVVESYLTALSYGLFVKFSQQCKPFDFYTVSIERIRRNLDGLIDILRMGGTNSFTAIIELSLTLSITTFSGLLGTQQQAAMAYCMQFTSFEAIMIAAFSYSCAQEVSRRLGAGQLRDAQKIARYGLATSLIYLIPFPLLFALYPKLLEILSGGVSEDISSILRTLMPIMSAGVILNAVHYNVLQQLRPLNDLLIPNIIALLGLSSGIGLAASLGFKTPMGIDGVALGYTCGIGVTAGALSLRWKAKVEELVVVDVENNTPLEQVTPAARGPWGCVSSFFRCSRDSSADQAQTNLQLLPENNF